VLVIRQYLRKRYVTLLDIDDWLDSTFKQASHSTAKTLSLTSSYPTESNTDAVSWVEILNLNANTCCVYFEFYSAWSSSLVVPLYIQLYSPLLVEKSKSIKKQTTKEWQKINLT